MAVLIAHSTIAATLYQLPLLLLLLLRLLRYHPLKSEEVEALNRWREKVRKPR